MDAIQVRWDWRKPLILGLTALAVSGLSACGDSDDESATTGTTGKTTADTQDEAKAPTERKAPSARDDGADGGGGGATAERGEASGADEQEQVADAVRDMYRAFASSDADAVCAGMSESAREQIAQQPPGGGSPAPGEGSCVDSLSRFLGAAAASGVLEQTLKATVTDVEVTGSSALATVSFGGPGGKVRLLKEDGAWRFGAPPSAAGAQ